MGPTVFETVKMRRKEVGGSSFLTEVMMKHVKFNGTQVKSNSHFNSSGYFKTTGVVEIRTQGVVVRML